MDKRTFLFVIALSLTLFGTNLFFQYLNQEKKQEWVVKQKTHQDEKEHRMEEAFSKRIARPLDLPLVDLYFDPEETQFAIQGINEGNSILTLNRFEKLPSSLFFKDSDDDSIKEYQLGFHQSALGTPVIYHLKGKNEPFLMSLLPEKGKFDLQIISFNPNSIENPSSITVGEYSDGRFSWPKFASPPLPAQENAGKFTAIALLKTNETFSPVGFYDPLRNEVVLPQKIEQLSKAIKINPSQVGMREVNQGEQFYVLENTYQQIVFSNYGGAIAEINLPFRSPSNHYSVVREIQFDRDMLESHPYNALFPSRSYFTPGENTKDPYVFHEKGQLGGFYPLLRRNLIELPPLKTIQVKPQFYALNFVSEFPEDSEQVYQVKSFTPNSITFESIHNYKKITKTYFLGDPTTHGPYCLHLDVDIQGDAKGLWISSGVPEVELISGSPASSLKYRITRQKKAEVEKIELPQNTLTVSTINPDWICNSNGFLGMILDPLTEIDSGFRVQTLSGEVVPSRLMEIDQEYSRYAASSLPGYVALLPLKTTKNTQTFRFFAGPFDSAILNQIDQLYATPSTGYNPDYISCQTMHGWFTFISEPFAKFLSILMNFFYSIFHSWALSIILLTVCLRLMLYPLNAWSTKSMLRMQQIAPEIAAIQEKYKSDPKKGQMEVLTLYREKKVNPASGCLPLLIQMPFLIGMFDLLKSSFSLRGASFIPGWIDDLTAPDVLFRWKYPIFFIGNEFHLLPLLLGFVMFAQQRFMSTAPSNPHMMTDQQRQQKAMGTITSIVFAIMFYHFPSGLNLYWLSSMLLGMLQQWYMSRTMKPIETAPPLQTHRKGAK